MQRRSQGGCACGDRNTVTHRAIQTPLLQAEFEPKFKDILERDMYGTPRVVEVWKCILEHKKTNHATRV